MAFIEVRKNIFRLVCEQEFAHSVYKGEIAQFNTLTLTSHQLITLEGQTYFFFFNQ